MNYISEAVLNETVKEMKQAIADHLEFCGAGHLSKEVNAIVELTLSKVADKYNI